jgi:hypothetical protein
MITRKNSARSKAENRLSEPDNSDYEFSSLDVDRNVGTSPVDSFHRLYEMPHVADGLRSF